MRRVMLLLIFAFSFIFAASVDAGTFLDDFDDGNDDGWVQEVGNWEVVDGEYRTPEAQEQWRTFALGGEEYGEFTIEVKIRNDKMHSTKGRSHAGVHFGDDGTPIGYWLYFRFHEGTLVLGTHLGHVTQTPVFDAMDLGNWHVLKAEVSDENSTLKTWVDGEEAFEVELELDATGMVGLWTEEHGGVSFDDVSITGDRIPSAVQPDSKLPITWGGVKAQY